MSNVCYIIKYYDTNMNIFCIIVTICMGCGNNAFD